MAKKKEDIEKIIAPVVTETEAQELVDAIAPVTPPALAPDVAVTAIEKCASLLARHGETGNLAEELVITIFNHDTVRVATVRKADRFTTQIATGATVEEACFAAYGKLAELKGLTV